MKKTSEKRSVALVKVNHREEMNMPPLGLLYIGDALKQAGYGVRVFHVSENEIYDCFENIRGINPVFAGFSILMGRGLTAALRLSELIRHRTGIPVVWGNVHASGIPEQCLNESAVDIVVSGEGEETAVELADTLLKNGNLAEVKGIIFKDAQQNIIHTEPREYIEDLDRFRMDFTLVDPNSYFQPNWDLKNIIRVVTSRGCPFECTFCHNPFYFSRKWRAHSAESVIRELTDLASHHPIEAFHFNDDNFFVNRQRAFTIVEQLKLPYFAQVGIELFNPETVERLHRSCCREVLIGYESGSDRVLKQIIKKHFTVSDAVETTLLLSRYPSIKITASFIVGLPGERKEDFHLTLELICRLIRIHPNMIVFVSFYIPIPGTELYDTCIRQGFEPPGRIEEWEPFYRHSIHYRMPWVDRIPAKDVIALRRAVLVLCAIRKFRFPFLFRIVEGLILREKFDHPLIAILDRLRTLLTRPSR